MRSDLLGGLQTFGFLGLLMQSGGLSLYSAWHCPWWATVLLVSALLNFPVFYGGWLFFLCNNNQHIGLQNYGGRLVFR